MFQKSSKLRLLILSSLFIIFCTGRAWGTEIRIPSVEGKSGQPVEIPIMIDQIENLAGVKLVMKYDPEILTFKKAVKTEQTGSLMHIVNDRTPGILIIVMAGAIGIKGINFPILKLEFETKKGLKEKQDTLLAITEAQLMSDTLKDVKNTVSVNPVIIMP